MHILKKVYLPNSITYIEYQAFKNCINLEYIELSNNITSIKSEAFMGCTNLVLTSLPKSLTLIGSYAFANCENIEKIDTKQQSDIKSCPYFTASNITKLDKWFQEDSKNFDKLFNEEELPLSIIISVQSIKKLQDKLDINIRPLNKERDLEIKFKTETKPKKYFDTKKPKQQIEKLIKYIRYNIYNKTALIT